MELTSRAFEAIVCPPRQAFIEKGKIGRHYRAISRNGSVLLMTRAPIEELAGVPARVRISTWHRSHLRGQGAEPWGILLCAAVNADAKAADTRGNGLVAVIGRERILNAALSLEMGGERTLNFVGRA